MSNLFLFTGEETYLLYEQVRSWKAAFKEKHGDMNLIDLDADEVGIGQIITDMTAAPFLADKRIIFVHGLPQAPKTRNKDKVTKKDEAQDEQLEKLAEALEDIPETSVVVFVQAKPDKRKGFYKKLVKLAEVKEFNTLEGPALMQWISKEAARQGATIASSEANYLVSLTGPDLWRLSQEITKLGHYKGNEAITRADIDKLVVPTMEANIFHLTDALGAKNHQKAIRNLHTSIGAGEDLYQVFYMVARQFRLFLQVGSFAETNPGANPTVIASALKLHPFVAKNTYAQVKNFKIHELKKAHGQLLELDHKLKTSRIRTTKDDQEELALAIEQFILEFCA